MTALSAMTTVGNWTLASEASQIFSRYEDRPVFAPSTVIGHSSDIPLPATYGALVSISQAEHEKIRKRQEFAKKMDWWLSNFE